MERQANSLSEKICTRYLRDTTSPGTIMESEWPSVLGTSCKSDACPSVETHNDRCLIEVPLEEEKEEEDRNDDGPEESYVRFAASQHTAVSSELEALKSSTLEGPEKVCERTVFIHKSQKPPPLSALQCYSGNSLVGSVRQSTRGDQHGSVHFIPFSSGTSDRTVIDYGASLDQVVVRTPDKRPNTHKGFVQLYLSKTSKGRQLRSRLRDPQVPKSSKGCRHERYSSYNVYSCVVGDGAPAATAFTTISVWGRRSTSCPVTSARADASSNALGRSALLVSSESQTLSTRSPVLGRNVMQRRFSDELLQYHLAVQNAKKKKYGLSIREVLASPGAADDDDEEDEQEDSILICEN